MILLESLTIPLTILVVGHGYIHVLFTSMSGAPTRVDPEKKKRREEKKKKERGGKKEKKKEKERKKVNDSVFIYVCVCVNLDIFHPCQPLLHVCTNCPQYILLL